MSCVFGLSSLSKCFPTCCRCRVGQRWPQNICWHYHQPGRVSWELYLVCSSILLQWVEDADPGSDVTAATLCHCMAVLDFFFFTLHSDKLSWNTAAVPLSLLLSCTRWLPESARWLSANGRAEAAHRYIMKCAEVNNRAEYMEGITPEVHFELLECPKRQWLPLQNSCDMLLFSPSFRRYWNLHKMRPQMGNTLLWIFSKRLILGGFLYGWGSFGEGHFHLKYVAWGQRSKLKRCLHLQLFSVYNRAKISPGQFQLWRFIDLTINLFSITILEPVLFMSLMYLLSEDMLPHKEGHKWLKRKTKAQQNTTYAEVKSFPGVVEKQGRKE